MLFIVNNSVSSLQAGAFLILIDNYDARMTTISSPES